MTQDTEKKDYKLVRKETGTRSVTLGKYIPAEWVMVEITEVDRESDNGSESVTLKFERIK